MPSPNPKTLEYAIADHAVGTQEPADVYTVNLIYHGRRSVVVAYPFKASNNQPPVEPPGTPSNRDLGYMHRYGMVSLQGGDKSADLNSPHRWGVIVAHPYTATNGEQRPPVPTPPGPITGAPSLQQIGHPTRRWSVFSKQGQPTAGLTVAHRDFVLVLHPYTAPVGTEPDTKVRLRELNFIHKRGVEFFEPGTPDIDLRKKHIEFGPTGGVFHGVRLTYNVEMLATAQCFSAAHALMGKQVEMRAIAYGVSVASINRVLRDRYMLATAKADSDANASMIITRALRAFAQAYSNAYATNLDIRDVYHLWISKPPVAAKSTSAVTGTSSKPDLGVAKSASAVDRTSNSFRIVPS